jgi:hypothetical protein
LPFAVGAARTHAPVKFTKPAGHCPATGQTPSWRGLWSGHAGAHVARMLSGTKLPAQVVAARLGRGRLPGSRSNGSASTATTERTHRRSVVSWIHA